MWPPVSPIRASTSGGPSTCRCSMQSPHRAPTGDGRDAPRSRPAGSPSRPSPTGRGRTGRTRSWRGVPAGLRSGRRRSGSTARTSPGTAPPLGRLEGGLRVVDPGREHDHRPVHPMVIGAGRVKRGRRRSPQLSLTTGLPFRAVNAIAPRRRPRRIAPVEQGEGAVRVGVADHCPGADQLAPLEPHATPWLDGRDRTPRPGQRQPRGRHRPGRTTPDPCRPRRSPSRRSGRGCA